MGTTCASSQRRLRYAASACSWSVRPVRCRSPRQNSGHLLAVSERCWHVLSRRPGRFFVSEAAGRRLAAGRAVIACACTRSSRCLRVIARPMSKVSGRSYAASFARSRSPHAPGPTLSGSCPTGATSTKAGQQTSSRRTVGCSRPIRHQHAFVRWSPRSRPASRNRRTRPAVRAGSRNYRSRRRAPEASTARRRSLRIGASTRSSGASRGGAPSPPSPHSGTRPWGRPRSGLRDVHHPLDLLRERLLIQVLEDDPTFVSPKRPKRTG